MQVGFSIHGDFITRHVRELWASCSYKKAFDLLDCMIGMTKEQQVEIIEGRAKLDGINELDMLEDDWKPSDDQYLNYPSFSEVMQRAEKFDTFLDYQRSEAILLATSYAKSYLRGDHDGFDAAWEQHMEEKGIGLIGDEDWHELLEEKMEEYKDEKDLQKLSPLEYVEQPKDDAYGMREEELKAMYARTRMSMLNMMINADRMEPVSLDDMMVKDRGLISTAEPVKDQTMKSNSGWLTNKGDFYVCKYMEHIGLAYNLLKDELGENANHEEVAENRGWVKITGRTDIPFIKSYHKKLTKKQKDKLFDYCEVHNIDYKEKVENYFD